MSSAQMWATRIQEVIRAAEADGFELLIDDEFNEQPRIELRVGKAGTDDDGALILEWNG